MANKLHLLASFLWLLATTSSSPLQLLPSMDLDDEVYDMSPDEADDFLQSLLLSKYGVDINDYPVPDQALDDQDNSGQPMSFNGGGDMPVSFSESEGPMNLDAQDVFGSDDVSDDANSEAKPEQEPLRDVVQNFKEDIPGTSTANPKNPSDSSTIAPSSTTSEPDVLASMPPVMPNNQGQKEFVMLRPPSENHRKLDHWMEEMEKGMEGLGMAAIPHHTVHKRKFAM